jgi:predicted HTH transcriptional regulator
MKITSAEQKWLIDNPEMTNVECQEKLKEMVEYLESVGATRPLSKLVTMGILRKEKSRF